MEPEPNRQGARQGFGQTAGPELTGRVCPYCRFPLKEGVTVEACTACGAVHHIECWQDNVGCSVTGCVNGPASTTATHVVLQAAAVPATAAHAVPPPPPPPSKPPPPPQSKRFPTGAAIAAAVVVVALLGAGAALAISSSSKNHNASTVTLKERTVEKTVPAAPTATAPHTTSTPPHASTPAPRSAPTPAPSSGPSTSEREAHAVAAVDSYWGDIENHDFSGAYQIEEPSAGSSESAWVHTEEREGVERVSYSFEPGSLEGNEATVNIGSLQTVASKTGCYRWTGYYRLTDYSGTWKITHDGLERHSC